MIKPPFFDAHGADSNEAMREWTRRVMQQINDCTPGTRLAEVPTLFAFGPIYRALAESYRLGQVSALRAAADALQGEAYLGVCDQRWLRDRATALEADK